MPYEFQYNFNKTARNGQRLHKTFKCFLRHRRCEYNDKGPRCRRELILGLPHCWQHLRIKNHLSVQDIPGKGKGVIAYWPHHGGYVFRPNDKICTYYGDLLSDEERDGRYHREGNSPYGFLPGRTPPINDDNLYNSLTSVDGSCVRWIGSLINAPYPHERSNAKFGSYNRDSNQLNIICTRNIYHGDEILLTYGKSYWDKNAFVMHSTKAVTRRYMDNNQH